MRFIKINQKGVTLVELMIAVAIMATMASTVVVARKLMATQTVRTDDRAFATEKAIQMFSELKSLISGSETGVQILDNYKDGTAYNTVLTTDKNVDTAPPGSGNPANVMSGNRMSNGNWRFLRQIAVSPLVNDSSARLITVKVWRYQSDQNPLQPGELLSEVGGILRTSVTLGNPTQVLDVYFIDINNIQGWWAQVPSLVSNIQQSFGNIESASNGTLQIRPHYITRSSYGRDSQYTPFINEATSTTSTASQWVYLYPGLVPQDSGVTAYFYEPDDTLSGVLQDGAFNIDGSIQNSTGLTGGVAYTVADQYNHSVRYPDEIATYNAVTAAYAANISNPTASNPITEISERMLIEGMLSSPQSFTNSLIINLHGELLPLPPMRDYSDAAKDPVNYPNYRVVTHPENLYYPATSGSSTNVNLRVYGYMDGFDSPSMLDSVAASSVTNMPYATVQITLPGLVYGAAQAATINGTAIYGDSTAADPYKP
jgi:prepilin-type N-terminal cleavage/methylation domain-containing protein